MALNWGNIAERAELSLFNFLLALSDLLPAIFFAIAFPLVLLLFIRFDEGEKILAPFELTFFSFIGLLVAYLTYLSKDTLLENLLPSFVVILAFFFQLFGRTKTGAEVPLGTKMTLAAGIVTVGSFVIGSRFFNLLFGGGGGG